MDITPKHILQELCKFSSSRKQLSLQLIFDICEEQHQRGSRDFSIATIGRLSSEKKGPSAAAIRNKTGEDYRTLIKIYADSVNGHTKKTSSHQSPAETILEGINDPVVRIRINILLAELKAMRAQLLATRHLANQTASIRIDQASSTLQDIPTPSEESSKQSSNRLTSLEIQALKLSIDQNTMIHWGWTQDASGRILSDSGQVIFQAGFVSAIHKALTNT